LGIPDEEKKNKKGKCKEGKGGMGCNEHFQLLWVVREREREGRLDCNKKKKEGSQHWSKNEEDGDNRILSHKSNVGNTEEKKGKGEERVPKFETKIEWGEG